MHIALCSSKSLYKYYFMAVSVWKYEVGRKSLFSSSIVPMSLGSIFKNSEGKWQAKRQHTQLSWLRAHCSSQPPPPCFAMVLSWACNVLPAHMQPFSFDFKLSTLWSLFIWYKVISNSTSVSSPDCLFSVSLPSWTLRPTRTGTTAFQWQALRKSLFDEWMNLQSPLLWAPSEISAFHTHLAFSIC